MKSLEFYRINTHKIALIIATDQYPMLKGKLNNILGTYPKGTKFTSVDEPRFIFPNDKLKEICKVCNVYYKAVKIEELY